MRVLFPLLLLGAAACGDARCPDNQPAYDAVHEVCCPRATTYSPSRRMCSADPDTDASVDSGSDLDAGNDAGSPPTCPPGTAWCDGRCTADPCFDPVVDVRVAREHTCALHASGRLSCWGRGSEGALGNGSTASSPRPVPVSFIETAVEIDVGTSGAGHSCARLANGRVWCWGTNANGEVGDATTTSRLEPVQLELVYFATDIDVGESHACAVADRNTEVWCWGRNSHGQVSGPNEGAIVSPREVLDLGASEANPVFSVSAGGTSSCAVLASGILRCWGRAVRAHLGDPVEARNEQPVDVGVSEVAVVVALDESWCALTASGVECWGLDSYGTLGDVSAPMHVWRGPVLVADVTAPSGTYLTKLTGSGHAVCTRADGSVFCWGVDAQLYAPIPPDVVSFTPRRVEALAAPSTIATSGGHACSAMPDGTALCWGGNSSGQLGSGGSASSPTPGPVLLPGR